MTIETVRSEQSRLLLDARGPFASVYFDDSHETPHAKQHLDATWRDVARRLEQERADPALVSRLEAAVFRARPPVGRSGRGLIATADRIVIDEHLVTSPAAPIVRLSELPYVVPLVEHGRVSPTYTVALVDHLGADITTYQRNTKRTETVEAGGYPLHSVANAENYGSGTQDRRVEEAIRKNLRAVADALSERFEQDLPEVVFLIGQDRARAELMSVLPDRVCARVVRPRVGARHTGVDDTVRHAIALEFGNRQHAEASEWTQRYRAEAGRRSGLAVEGLTAVCAALREDAVSTLLLGGLGDEIVLAGDNPTLVATDADALSRYGAPPTRTLRADEAVPFAAIARGAKLIPIRNGLDVLDGVAALLRYPVPADA